MLQPDLSEYDFTANFFSDLGRTRTFADQPNTLVCALFSITVIVAGLATVLFSVKFPSLFTGTSQHKPAKLGALFGIVSGVCYIGVGLTPWDVYFNPHILFVKIGFSSFLAASLLLGWVMYRNSNYPKLYVWVYLAFILILIAYLYLLFYGPKDMKSAAAVQTQVIAQKVLLYSQMATMVIQCIGAYNYANKSLGK